MLKIASNRAKSPILFNNIALIAALLAWTRVNQKLIKRYDVTPTPSQPTNICKKLFAVTKTNIKKVNNERYDINRARCGSFSIYSVEYRCTNVDIVVTTQSITTVKLSKQKFQLITQLSETIQGVKLIKYTSPLINIVQKTYNEMKNAHAVKLVVIIHTPKFPRKFPNKLPDKKPNAGSAIIANNIDF